ncbi:hypothetical protein ACH4CD_11380 [Streptomyces fungicidicus]|uniref:hypothetical protein n=1 Tax=Streptomyces fungicidicus TaxID=68203 RepID=UPI00378C89EC
MLSEVDPVVLDFVRGGHVAGLDVPDGETGDDSSALHDGLHLAAEGAGTAAAALLAWRSLRDAKSWWRKQRDAAGADAAQDPGDRGLPPARDGGSAKKPKEEVRLKRSDLVDLARSELIEEFDLPEDEPLEIREQDYEVSESAWRFVFVSGADAYEVLVVAKGSRAAVLKYNHTRE